MAINFNPTRKNAEIGFATILVAVAAWIYFEAKNYPGQSASYPRVLAVMLGLCAIIIIVRSVFRAPDGTFLTDHLVRCLGGFAFIFLYIVAIDWFGYIIPSLIFSITIPVFLGYRQWKIILPVAFGAVFSILLIFKVMLERPIPPDIFNLIFGTLL